jgi:hypothetical protein
MGRIISGIYESRPDMARGRHTSSPVSFIVGVEVQFSAHPSLKGNFFYHDLNNRDDFPPLIQYPGENPKRQGL